jgi:hypothetical protein
MFKKRRTDRAEPRFDRDQLSQDIAPLQAPQQKPRPAFKLKGPSSSIRLLGLIGGLSGCFGAIGVILGMGVITQSGLVGLIIITLSLLVIVWGVLFAAAYRVSIAIVDLRDMAKFRLDNDL